jgi:hypothetical protein
MKAIIAALLFVLAAASGTAQTLKSLVYNTNGQVLFANTNTLTFTNATVRFKDITMANLTISNEFTMSDGEAFGVNGELNMVGTFNFSDAVKFGAAAATRTNLGIPLAALTNTSNVTVMRALAGSTNTNQPFSGTVSLTNTNTLTFSNGILLSQ